MKNNLRAFTFVELIVTTLIITILTAIWFVSYIGFIADSRDSQRRSDLSKVSSSLKIYKQKRWYYSEPWDYFNILNNTVPVAKQWKMNKWVYLNTLDKLPFDPKSKSYYSYAVTNNKQEFQLSATLENEDEEIAILDWNYKTVSKNVLPTIILAIDSTTDIEIHEGIWAGSTNRAKFIFDQLTDNLPYTMWTPDEAYNEWTSFSGILNKAETLNSFWQNNDYRNCVEIVEAWKSISANSVEEQYQILDNGSLTNTGCTFTGQ
jgi:Tfp pilus assembly protein PilE